MVSLIFQPPSHARVELLIYWRLVSNQSLHRAGACFCWENFATKASLVRGWGSWRYERRTRNYIYIYMMYIYIYITRNIYLKVIVSKYVARLCRFFGSQAFRKNTHTHMNLMKTRRYAKTRRCIWPTLNPGHSRLFTWARILIPILLCYLDASQKLLRNYSYYV